VNYFTQALQGAISSHNSHMLVPLGQTQGQRRRLWGLPKPPEDKGQEDDSVIH